MFKSPRLLHLFRQAAFRDGALRAPMKQTGPRRLPSPIASQKRALTTGNVRSLLGQRGRRKAQGRAKSNVRTHRGYSARVADGAKPRSLSERMKDMSRKYGWTVTGIYLGLSVLDFPFCFLAVKWLGTERIAEVEHTIMDGFWNMAEKVMPSLQERRLAKEAGAAEEAATAAREAGDQVVEQAKTKNPGLGTQLLLAYGVHKSLIFFRIPITLAITPKVVKQLRKWGWQIGKPKSTPV
ncbi:hypothetical protein CERZMDRAFT_113321 [Cercospora zeae-maydis SCOH1-5]|uniref:DUF1279 domain-containing protein n=1 Tax=Cercospora zeae-maydis SCOH1-5 TaxID=717836 RepID=A0A6A6FAE6_9PEZI|nr:hypothetical protein CERZMDRAFT_113321 [Cercospora zeae-maydis SCOH1-5]